MDKQRQDCGSVTGIARCDRWGNIPGLSFVLFKGLSANDVFEFLTVEKAKSEGITSCALEGVATMRARRQTKAYSTTISEISAEYEVGLVTGCCRTCGSRPALINQVQKLRGQMLLVQLVRKACIFDQQRVLLVWMQAMDQQEAREDKEKRLKKAKNAVNKKNMEIDELTNQFEKDNYKDDIQDAIQKMQSKLTDEIALDVLQQSKQAVQVCIFGRVL